MELVRKFTRKVEENGMSIFDENRIATKVEVVDETANEEVTA